VGIWLSTHCGDGC